MLLNSFSGLKRRGRGKSVSERRKGHAVNTGQMRTGKRSEGRTGQVEARREGGGPAEKSSGGYGMREDCRQDNQRGSQMRRNGKPLFTWYIYTYIYSFLYACSR